MLTDGHVIRYAGICSGLARARSDVALVVLSRGLRVEPERLVAERVDAGTFADAVAALSSAPLAARKATIAAAYAIASATAGLEPEEIRALLEIESALCLAPA